MQHRRNLVPYGVLDPVRSLRNTDENVVGTKPDKNMIITDPAGLNYIQDEGPRAVGAASKAITPQGARMANGPQVIPMGIRGPALFKQVILGPGPGHFKIRSLKAFP